MKYVSNIVFQSIVLPFLVQDHRFHLLAGQHTKVCIPPQMFTDMKMLCIKFCEVRKPETGVSPPGYAGSTHPSNAFLSGVWSYMSRSRHRKNRRFVADLAAGRKKAGRVGKSAAQGERGRLSRREREEKPLTEDRVSGRGRKSPFTARFSGFFALPCTSLHKKCKFSESVENKTRFKHLRKRLLSFGVNSRAL